MELYSLSKNLAPKIGKNVQKSLLLQKYYVQAPPQVVHPQGIGLGRHVAVMAQTVKELIGALPYNPYVAVTGLPVAMEALVQAQVAQRVAVQAARALTLALTLTGLMKMATLPAHLLGIMEIVVMPLVKIVTPERWLILSRQIKGTVKS